MELPESLQSLLAGMPEIGVPEQAVLLLSVDDSGFPHVCLLCRAQLAVSPDRLDVVVTSRRTRRFLQSRGQGTMVVVGNKEAYYCKLRVRDIVDDGWALAASFELDDCVTDRSSVAMQGITYIPDASLEEYEQWSRCRELLAALARRR